MDTLVLSDSYIPIDRVTWQDAISDVLSGRAEILESYEGRVIRTASEVFPMPSVIRFVRKVAGLFRKKRVEFTRKNVWLRDGGKCQYCGDAVTLAEFTYDHVIPASQGGPRNWTNIVVACIPCNQHKRNRTPAEARMKLISTPVQPKTLPKMDREMPFSTENMPETWRDYLASFMYWNGSFAS